MWAGCLGHLHTVMLGAAPGRPDPVLSPSDPQVKTQVRQQDKGVARKTSCLGWGVTPTEKVRQGSLLQAVPGE